MNNSIDCYFGEIYHRQDNNCLHFSAKVWAKETGGEFKGVYDFLHGKCSLATARKFKKLKEPVSPCIAVFKGGTETHIAIFIRGKILHFTEAGVQYQPLDVVMFGFSHVRFYLC